MGFMTIDGKQVEFTDEPNVLSVIRKADIDIPTLCYHSELSVYGACRLCTVENEKGKTLFLRIWCYCRKVVLKLYYITCLLYFHAFPAVKIIIILTLKALHDKH